MPRVQTTAAALTGYPSCAHGRSSPPGLRVADLFSLFISSIAKAQQGLPVDVSNIDHKALRLPFPCTLWRACQCPQPVFKGRLSTLRSIRILQAGTAMAHALQGGLRTKVCLRLCLRPFCSCYGCQGIPRPAVSIDQVMLVPCGVVLVCKGPTVQINILPCKPAATPSTTTSQTRWQQQRISPAPGRSAPYGGTAGSSSTDRLTGVSSVV